MKSVVKVEATVKESIDDEIAELVGEVRRSQSVIEDHSARIQNAKERLAQLLTLRRSNWKDDVGYARIVSEGTRITYDTSALDDLIIHEPLRYGWLKDYRQESPVAGRIMVK